MIPTGRDCGLAEWINYISLLHIPVFMNYLSTFS